MAKSKKILVLTGFLLLLLASQVAFQVSTGIENEIGDNSKVNMINGVLAHDMNESQARSLSENGFFVEADVELEENSRWQTIYSLCKQYNISLIGKICHNTMSGNTSVPSNAEWIQTIQTAVNNFSDVVKYWEIWNEPTDNEHFFSGNASEYTWMLKVANQTIKTISPNAVVIGLGGLHLYSGVEEWVTKGLDFAANVTALGGLDYCDAISLHAYPWGNYTSEVGDNITKSLDLYRNLTQNKPIWITETGQHSNSRGYAEKDQADFLYNSYKLLKNQNVSAYIWYQLSDSNGDVLANDTFGLFDEKSNPKMAFQTYTMVKSEDSIALAAVEYLTSCYDSEVGLIYETPDNNGTTFWIYSDNYLVQLALAHYEQNETIKQFLRNIQEVSSNLTMNEPGIVNQYQILNFSRIILPIKNSTNCKIAEFNSKTINCTINNGTGTLSAENYADIAFLEAIAYQNENQTKQALSAYQKGVTRWNETGFIDEAYNDSRGFDTFKLALYICASKAIDHPFDVRAYNNLLSCQLSTGGFATYYTANNVTNVQTNTETTALAILALTYEPKPEIKLPVVQPTPTPTPSAPTTPAPTTTPTSTPAVIPTPISTAIPTPSPTLTPTPTATRQPTTPTPTLTNTSFDPLFFAVAGFSAVFAVLGGLFLIKKHKS